MNADIFGVSQGGMIAQYLAIDRPDLVNQLVLAVTLSKNNETVERTVNDWIHITEQNNMKRLITDMAERMYSDIYVKRYKPFMSLLAVLQKPKNVPRFIALAKACLSCKAYDELDKIQCPVFVIGGMQDKVVSGEASLEIAKKLGCEIFMYDDLGHAAYEEANSNLESRVHSVKRIRSKFLKVIFIIVAVIVLFIIVSFIRHKICSFRERKLLTPLGKIVEVNGHNMSVYTEGEGDKTLVFLSGGGTCSPILDFKSLYSLLSKAFIFSTTTMGKRMIIISECRYRNLYIQNMM